MNRAEIFDRVNHALELSLTPNPVQYINTSSRRIEEVSIKWLDLRADFSGSSGSLIRYADDKPADYEFLR